MTLYEDLLNAVRALYEDHLDNTKNRQAAAPAADSRSTGVPISQSPFSQVQQTVQNGKLVEFDHLFSTLRIGKSGSNACYWVHPDNYVELQLLLVQYARSWKSYRRDSTLSDSAASSSTPTPTRASDQPDTFNVIADNQEKYLIERSAQTLEANESRRGSTLQKAVIHVRGNQSEDAAIVARRRPAINQTSTSVDKLLIKRKCIQHLLERDPLFSAQKAAVPSVTFADTEPSYAGTIQTTRDWLAQHPDIQPIATILSKRTRFFDTNIDASGILLASLDTMISINYGVTLEPGVRGCSNFPFGVLRIRQEGPQRANIIQILDSSHLVRGISFEASL